MPDPGGARRIRIVGISGAGKTQLAAEVAAATGLAHLELDAVFWQADWQFRDLDEARAAVRAFADAHPEGWVADGNWNSRLDGLLDPGTPGGADQVVWLDHSRPFVMRRVVGPDAAARHPSRGALARQSRAPVDVAALGRR